MTATPPAPQAAPNPTLVHPGIPVDPNQQTQLDADVRAQFVMPEDLAGNGAPGVAVPPGPVTPVAPAPAPAPFVQPAPAPVQVPAPFDPTQTAPPVAPFVQPAPAPTQGAPVQPAPVQPEPPRIDPWTAPAQPAPTDTVDFFGSQITREEAQVVAQTREWLNSLSPVQMQRLIATLQEPEVPVQQQQPAYPQPPAPTYPNDGRFFSPAPTPGVPAPPIAPLYSPPGAPLRQPSLDPFASEIDPNAAYLQQQQAAYQQQVAAQQQQAWQQQQAEIAQLRGQVAATAQSTAEFQAQQALRQQAEYLRPYGDAALQDITTKYQLPPHEAQYLVTRLSSAGQLLDNAFAQSPNDPRAAYTSVLDAVLWADPNLRPRAIAASTAQAQQQLDADRAARARAGQLAASGGSIPRGAPGMAPTTTSGQLDLNAGMVDAIRQAMVDPAPR